MKPGIISLLFSTASAGTILPHDRILRQIQGGDHDHGINHDAPHVAKVSSSTPTSLVYTYYASSTCNDDATSAVGYTLGQCISSGDSGIQYDKCEDNGSKVFYTFSSCSSSDCSSGCMSYDMSVEKCEYGTKVSCSESDEPWKDYKEFTYHYSYFYGDADCSNDVDMWSAVPIRCNEAYNMNCTVYSDDLSVAATCDLPQK